MKIQVALVLTLCALLPRLTFSQSERRETVSQQIQWFSLTNNFKVSKRVTVLAEGQFRFANELQPMQFQFRTAGEIQVRKDLSIVPVGYVYTWNPIYGKQPAQFVNNEHRIFQQVLFKHQSGRFNISHRGRLEQRFIEVHTMHNGEVTYQGYDYYANRFRYRLMVNVPLNTREIGTRTLFASFYDEVFLSWGPSVTYNKPDQNRVFMGIGYQLHKDFLITSGLVYQMLVKANGTMQENNFGFQISATHNIDLTNSL
jgi:hypothetical protein